MLTWSPTPTEAQVYPGPDGDVVVTPTECSAEDVLVRGGGSAGLARLRACSLRRYRRRWRVWLRGKGNIAFHLAPSMTFLFVSGHRTRPTRLPDDGREFTHTSLPSGTRAGSGVASILSARVQCIPGRAPSEDSSLRRLD